jgi:hypothetical protein
VSVTDNKVEEDTQQTKNWRSDLRFKMCRLSLKYKKVIFISIILNYTLLLFIPN